MSKPGERRLSPDDWAAAALAAIARGGLDAVVVEAIAKELGATKGSFYWHFKNRDALIEAALELWEQRTTEVVIGELEREADPAERLRKLLSYAVGSDRGGRAEIALLASPDHPAALRAVRHAARRRIDYMAAQYELLGWERNEALDRAVVSYYVFVGHMQMTHVVPDIVSADSRRRQQDLVFEALVSGAPPSSSGRHARDGE